MPENPLVVIRSLVYNHEPYLRQCLDGFVMQQTTFPFVAVVHDDCSTDNSAAILREYAEKYPDIIKPVYETENQYSKRDGSLNRIMAEACGKYGAKYIALCEGDDYWTDPHKLQKQVEFLEAHPEYTMACCNGVIETPSETLSTEEEYQKLDWPYKKGSGDCTLEELVRYGGRYMLTAGLVYRNGLKDNYPLECRNLPCGDYVLKVFAALTGKMYYFEEQMVVYRFQSSTDAWSTRALGKKVEHLGDVAWKHDIHMLAAADRFSGYEHMELIRSQAFTLVSYILAFYPQIFQEIIQEMGYVLEYRYHAPYMDKKKMGWLRRARFLVQRWCYHPYLPQPRLDCLLRPCLRPFYKTLGPKRSYCIAGRPVLSVVDGSEGRRVFLCGFRIK